jgi:hypothetical protein
LQKKVNDDKYFETEGVLIHTVYNILHIIKLFGCQVTYTDASRCGWTSEHVSDLLLIG